MKISPYSLIVNKTSLRKMLVFLFIFMVLQFLINGNMMGVGRLLEITGGTSIPDLNFYNSPAQIYEIFEMLGEEGRHFYLTRIIPLDFIFPLSYTLFLLFSLALVYKRIFENPKKVKPLLIVGSLGCLLDYGENICNTIILIKFPERISLLPSLSGVLTSGKFIFIFSSYLILFLGILIILLKSQIKRLRSSK